MDTIEEAGRLTIALTPMAPDAYSHALIHLALQRVAESTIEWQMQRQSPNRWNDLSAFNQNTPNSLASSKSPPDFFRFLLDRDPDFVQYMLSSDSDALRHLTYLHDEFVERHLLRDRLSNGPTHKEYDSCIAGLAGRTLPVRLQLEKASIGSLVEEFAFVSAGVLADPDARAIMQNLAANMLWAIANSLRQMIVVVRPQGHAAHPASSNIRLPRSVARIVEKSLDAVAANNSGSMRFHFKAQSGEELLEMDIDIER